MTEPAGDIQIRLASVADLPFIVQGAQQLALLERNDAALPLRSDLEQRLQNYFQQLLDMPAALILVAEHNGRPCAYIAGSLQLMPNDFTEVSLYGLIQVLWVDESVRRHQLGQTLVTMFEHTLREQGVSHIDTQHARSNIPAEKFWLKCGYEPVSCTVRKML